MAKRRKTIYAGDMVYDVIYTMPTPRIGSIERRAIRQISDEAMAKWNCTTATRKLEMRMAAGFRLNDLVVTLTYRDEDYPETMPQPSAACNGCCVICVTIAVRAGRSWSIFTSARANMAIIGCIIM